MLLLGKHFKTSVQGECANDNVFVSYVSRVQIIIASLVVGGEVPFDSSELKHIRYTGAVIVYVERWYPF